MPQPVIPADAGSSASTASGEIMPNGEEVQISPGPSGCRCRRPDSHPDARRRMPEDDGVALWSRAAWTTRSGNGTRSRRSFIAKVVQASYPAGYDEDWICDVARASGQLSRPSTPKRPKHVVPDTRRNQRREKALLWLVDPSRQQPVVEGHSAPRSRSRRCPSERLSYFAARDHWGGAPWRASAATQFRAERKYARWRALCRLLPAVLKTAVQPRWLVRSLPQPV